MEPGLHAVVLAGGKSSRFHLDKRFAILNGLPLFVYPLALCASLTDKAILLVSSGERKRFRSALKAYPELSRRTVVRCDRKRWQGPLLALSSFARSAKLPPDALLLVLAADMPGVEARALRALIAAARAHPQAGVCLFRHLRRPQLFPSVWRKSALLSLPVSGRGKEASFECWASDHAGWLHFLPFQSSRWKLSRQRFFANINTPEDLLGFAPSIAGGQDDAAGDPTASR